jgi:hypothetical protein
VFFEESEPVPKKTYFSVDVPKPLKYAAKTQKILNMNRVFVTAKETMSSKAGSSKKKEERMQID